MKIDGGLSRTVSKTNLKMIKVIVHQMSVFVTTHSMLNLTSKDVIADSIITILILKHFILTLLKKLY